MNKCLHAYIRKNGILNKYRFTFFKKRFIYKIEITIKCNHCQWKNIIVLDNIVKKIKFALKLFINLHLYKIQGKY